MKIVSLLLVKQRVCLIHTVFGGNFHYLGIIRIIIQSIINLYPQNDFIRLPKVRGASRVVLRCPNKSLIGRHEDLLPYNNNDRLETLIKKLETNYFFHTFI